MNADGTGQVQLAPTPDCREADLDWSSEGRLAYTSEPTDHYFPQVYVANADNTGEELIAAPARAPNWSPGGLWLAFVNDPSNPRVIKTSMDPSRANRELGRGQTPEWSPEGDRIAISGTPIPGSTSGVWNMPEVGGRPHQRNRPRHEPRLATAASAASRAATGEAEGRDADLRFARACLRAMHVARTASTARRFRSDRAGHPSRPRTT